MSNLFERMINADSRKMHAVEKEVAKVEKLAAKCEAMSNVQLAAETPKLKKRLQDGETLDDVLPEAFAIAREACRRVRNEYPFHVQLLGAAVMHNGDIAEMKTGEGKTLTSVMTVYLNALEGKGVHVVTVNDYLAKRDAINMGKIYSMLGLSVGLNAREMSPEQKRAAYACDVTYTTNSELGFDYLRDNMVKRPEDRVLRGLHFALIDEIDSILIDEARTPLIISGGSRQTANLYLQADRFAKSLSKSDYEIDIKDKVVQLTAAGITKAEHIFRVDNLYKIENNQLAHRIAQALKANYIMENDIDYVVDRVNDEIVIVDPNTGRLMKGREWSDGLHQAVCAKENVNIRQETITLATITYQNFFRLYDKLAGMTGTAKSSEEEFHDVYNMLVFAIPTNMPVIRIDSPDVVYGTKELKYAAIVEEVRKRHAKGQPILLGTIAVETSELLSKRLDAAGIPHEVLNAKNNEREAEIIAKAGQMGAVTIATNMAGRGTDIKLGEGVPELGGLCVIGSERHESPRIDNQLRGRSGRQGDPGYSCFFVSLEDNLMRRFGSERLEGLFQTIGSDAITSKTITKAIDNAQMRVEGLNYDARKTMLQYDDVLREQRENLYDQRNLILDQKQVRTVLEKMYEKSIRNVVEVYWPLRKEEGPEKESAYRSFCTLGLNELAKDSEMDTWSAEDAAKVLTSRAWKLYCDRTDVIKDEMYQFERQITLTCIDEHWTDHLSVMSKLRDGIGLRSYAQDNPLQAYVKEGFNLYERMLDDIAFEVTGYCAGVHVEVQQQPAVPQAVPAPSAAA